MSGPAPRGTDWADCVAAGVGDEVEIHGVRRRRFFRSDGGSQTRLEVEVLRARRA